MKNKKWLLPLLIAGVLSSCIHEKVVQARFNQAIVVKTAYTWKGDVQYKVIYLRDKYGVLYSIQASEDSNIKEGDVYTILTTK